MEVVGVPPECAGAYLDKRDSVAVVGIHVGVDFEHESREFLFFRLYRPLFRFPGKRGGGNLDKAVEQFPDTEIVQCGTEKHRSDPGFQVFFAVQSRIDFPHQFQVFPQLGGSPFADMFVQFPGIGVRQFDARRDVLDARAVQAKIFAVQVVNTFKGVAASDGPAQRVHFDLQFPFHIVQNIERVIGRTVQFIDKNNDRCFAHPAHLHQLAGLAFHSLGGIDDDDDAVAGSQGTESVLREILVSGGIENIDFYPVVFESHHRGRH